MRKLFVALLIFCNSLTNSNFSNAFSDPYFQNKFSNNTVEVYSTLNTALRGNEYLRNNFSIITNNTPTGLPIDLNGFYRISDYYGYRGTHPVTGKPAFHHGIDFSGYKGTNILAAADGVVKKVKRSSGYGKLIVLDHGNGIESYYAHLSKYSVKEGQTVKKGDIIAKLGNTGISSGPHLHFEVRVNNNSIDPTLLLESNGIQDEEELLSKMSYQKNNHDKEIRYSSLVQGNSN